MAVKTTISLRLLGKLSSARLVLALRSRDLPDHALASVGHFIIAAVATGS